MALSASALFFCSLAIIALPMSETSPWDYFPIAPINTAAVIGHGPVQLNCTASTITAKIKWSEYITGGSTPNTISIDGDLEQQNAKKDRYNITGTFHLVVLAPQHDDTGRYECNNNYGSYDVNVLLIMLHEPHFIVTGLDNELVEGAIFTIVCSVEYGGSWPPVLDIYGPSGPISSTDNSQLNVTSKQASVTVNKQDQGQHYGCRVYFNEAPSGLLPPNSSHIGFDTTIPSYTFNQQTKSLDISYPPESISITPNKQNFHPNESITCTSSANPSPVYEWRDAGGRLLSSNAILQLSEDMEGQRIFKCIAANIIKGDRQEREKEFTINILGATNPPPTTDQPEGGANIGVIIGVVIGGVLVLVIVVGLVAFCLRRRRLKKEAAAKDYVTVSYSSKQDPERSSQYSFEYENHSGVEMNPGGQSNGVVLGVSNLPTAKSRDSIATQEGYEPVEFSQSSTHERTYQNLSSFKDPPQSSKSTDSSSTADKDKAKAKDENIKTEVNTIDNNKIKSTYSSSTADKDKAKAKDDNIKNEVNTSEAYENQAFDSTE